MINGLMGSGLKYANITAVGALIVFMVFTMFIMTYATIKFIDAHNELTKAFREVAVELKELGLKNEQSAFELRLELRNANDKTQRLIDVLVKNKED
jgi:hypothetical protein